MARQQGTLKLGSNIEARVDAPLDARSLVADKAELLDAGSFPYFYQGMLVTVQAENRLYMLIGDDTTQESNWKQVGGSGGGGASELEDPITAAVDVGGVTAGTTFTAGTSIEAVLRAVLSPTLYPSLTPPSATLTGSGAKLLETGATLVATLTATLNRGSINPAYGTSGNRAGEATGYALNGGASQATGTWSETVSETNRTFQAVISHAAGEQPKDSVGANYDEPLAAGSVTSNTVTYDFVPALWSNAADIATIAKEALVAKSAKVKEFSFPAQTVANPETFDVPASWTVTAVEVLNDLSGKWEDCSGEFAITDTTHDDAAGNPLAYKRYTDNRGYNAGPRSVRVKWS